ncbi:MAG: AAA family ATPase [Gammaproteobacteria bacterium]
MSEIKKITLKDVRCFGGRQEFNIRPLTFLVGENSTGKSTVLGCMQALGDFVAMRRMPFFNRPAFDLNADPYKMGAFADIVRNVGDQAKKIRSFELGFKLQIDSITLHLRTTLVERESGSEPSVARIEIEFDEGLVICEVVERSGSRRFFGRVEFVEMKEKSEGNTKPTYLMKTSAVEDLLMAFWVFDAPRHFWPEPSQNDKTRIIEKLEMFAEKINSRSDQDISDDEITDISRFFPPYVGTRFASFAPVRAKPERLYSPDTDKGEPDGSSIPMTLINLYRKDAKRWKTIRKALVKFGKSSGLFTNINMKPLGKSVNNPFQIQLQIESGGPKVNIADVGYGISQILPVLVRVFTAQRETTFLVQQPEVHLHPKGQAELCSLFVDVAKQIKHSFVVETHSDYMVNRARIEIMKGKISPDDVSLIYLEPVKNKVKVHNITFDKNANFNPPKSYGEFFLRESNRMLGFED